MMKGTETPVSSLPNCDIPECSRRAYADAAIPAMDLHGDMSAKDTSTIWAASLDLIVGRSLLLPTHRLRAWRKSDPNNFDDAVGLWGNGPRNI